MKSPFFSALLLSCWVALSLALPGSAIAYDSPDFDAGVFARDGIFLAEDQKKNLLEALAALASDFSTSPRVDDDLREKALGIALRIDPMHAPSRLAHRAFARGETPAATNFFDTLSAVSETLWTHAVQLASPPLEPEHLRLAPFLMELSLLTHAAPSDERLAVFAGIANGKNLTWGTFLSLQPEDNPSTGRAQFLRQEGVIILSRQEKKENEAIRTAAATPSSDRPDLAANTTDPAVAPGLTVMTPSLSPDRPDRPAQMEPVVASLPVVRLIEAVESKPAVGVFTLTMRSPAGRAERQMLGLPVGSDAVPNSAPAPLLPLVPSRESIAFESLEIPAPLAASQNWKWPAGVLGEVAFSATTPLPGPLRLIRTRALLPSVVLIDSLLRKAPLNDQMILSGEIDPISSEIVLPGGVIATIETAAGGMKGKYLLVPESAAQELIAVLVKTGQLDLLFSNELLSYTTLAEVITHVSSPTPETLSAASVIFREIEAVSTRMPLTDLARNAKVMERLESILATNPEHLSARAMLEFGRLPESPEMRNTLSATRINDIVTPLFRLEDPTADLNALALQLDPAKLELSRLRTDVPPDVRDFHAAGEVFLDACELYLDLTNKGTALGLQRLRESKKARSVFEERGTSLGLLYPEREVE